MAKDTLSPAQRAMNFATRTRQHWQTLTPVTVAENGSVSFDLPKPRFLSKIRLMIENTITVAHAANTTFTVADFAPYVAVKNVRVEANNNFNPVSVSGIGAAILNALRDNASSLNCYSDTVALTTASRARNKLSNVSSVAGTANPFRCVLDIPITLNDRDPVGLILLQNDETTVTVTIDMDDADKLLSAVAGYTVTAGTYTITPMIETFSIPPIAEAYPDLSILKIWGETSKTIAGAGQVDLDLPTGNTYRKLALYITDAAGGEDDADLSGNFELIFNHADIPYRLSHKLLSAINQEQYGKALPNGVFVFDFTYQGLSNYGGTRDYIDTERLVSLLFRFTAAAAGNIKAIYEQTSKLQ